MILKERFRLTIEYFRKTMPEPETELEFRDPFELLVAVILSAQCTDKRVNMITPVLLAKYPDAYSLSKATPSEVFEYIKSCSYPNNKSKHLVGMAKMVVERFNGTIPEEPEVLQQLPGVGRKTANVVASIVYRKPLMAVDTHVFRVAKRIGLTEKAKTPLETELILTRNIPEELVRHAHHWLILHGRYICRARKPLCDNCGISAFCKYFEKEKRKIRNSPIN